MCQAFEDETGPLRVATKKAGVVAPKAARSPVGIAGGYSGGRSPRRMAKRVTPWASRTPSLRMRLVR
jgi:hypothetical protein